jgi:dienelactone hydrolase
MSSKNCVSLVAIVITLFVAIGTSGCGGQSVPPPPISVSITPSAAQTMNQGQSLSFAAVAANDSSNRGASWSLSGTGCTGAACGALSNQTTTTANYIAPNAIAANLSVKITATSVSDPSAFNSVMITIPGISIVVTANSPTVEVQTTTQVTATAVNDTTNKGITWALSCSAPSCGMISPSVTASGIATTYTAPTTPPGNDLPVTITAASVANPSASGSTSVIVPAIIVSTAPGSSLLPVSIAQQFTATVKNDRANPDVMWALTQGGTACSPGCGSVAPSITASGSPTTYTAPAALPANPTVTLTGTSVADTTKSTVTTITISAGTVKLVPNFLDFGSVVVNTSSSPQTAMLTNTGNSALNIASITITGTNAADFSQSHTCATSVEAGNVCTLSVAFRPIAKGLRSASISISDTSPDSPQQISLSGTGHTLGGKLSASALPTTLRQEQTQAAPIPVGPDKVGTRIMDLVDSSRNDPFSANGVKRELLVRFWYPASLNQGCQPAQYTSPKVWNYFSKLVGAPLPGVTTNSCLTAPVADGAHPVVVFTPGYTGTFTDYTYLFEDLASRGYVVASVDHTSEATAVEFPDGRLVTSVLGSHLANTWRGDAQTLSFATTVRLEDLRFVADELGRLNVQADGPLAGKLDTSRVAIAGHSMGGATAFLKVLQEPRYRAGIIMDGFLPNALLKPTETPVLILAAGREKWSSDECTLWSDLQGPRLAVNLIGAEHVAPSDEVWLTSDVIQTGDMGPQRMMAAVRDYIGAFLDANLRGQPSNSLLTGPSTEYPGVTVTTQNEPLGGCPDKAR